MDIDKSNVRFVIHYNMPKGIEAFYQEISRCSRAQEPDPLTRQIVQERDRERLRKMTFYCFTNECLRDYILRYFGEYGSDYCGNCQNCITWFETVDVTEIAKALIGCVSSCRQRYGVNVIIDTVHGANTAKYRQYRMAGNPFCGSPAKMPVYRLRQVLNHLMLNEYLTVTEDEYAIVKLTGKTAQITEENETATMKMPREQEREAWESSQRMRKKKGTADRPAELGKEMNRIYEFVTYM